MKEIFLLHLILLQLLNAKLFSCVETTSMPSLLQLPINTHLMVSFQEPFQWVLLVPELMVMMLSHVWKWPEKPENIFWKRRSLTLLSSWHTEWVIILHPTTHPCTEMRMKEENGNKKMILLSDWLNSWKAKSTKT